MILNYADHFTEYLKHDKDDIFWFVRGTSPFKHMNNIVQFDSEKRRDDSSREDYRLELE